MGGSRWSSPIPSLRAFTLNRRGSSSPRLGGSPRIAPSPVPAPRRDKQVILAHDDNKTGPPSSTTGPAGHQQDVVAGNSRGRSFSIGGDTNSNALLTNNNDVPYERPQSARSYSSTSYSGIPPSFLGTCDTETAFRTVCVLFPTAGEPHIRHLFHKWVDTNL